MLESSLEGIDDSKRFLKIFKAEATNRGVALVVMKKFAEVTRAAPEGSFWAEYHRLEILNERMYSPYVRKYGSTMTLPLITKSMLRILFAVRRIMPRLTLKIISDSTNKYVADLEEMQQLAGQQDQDFFEFVVLQEQAQAEGMMLLRDKKYDAAAHYLKTFVDEWSSRTLRL